MRADPLLLTAGEWLGIAGGGLLVLTLVAFLAGDAQHPVVIGSLWNGVDTPPDSMDHANNRRSLTSRSGHRLHVWFCGLASADLHLRRVRSRVAHGGHDIPEEKIRERWKGSRENLVRLLPLIDHLRVYDNSTEADPAKGHRPKPVLLLEMQRGKITAPADLSGAPDWAQPIIAAAIHLHIAER